MSRPPLFQASVKPRDCDARNSLALCPAHYIFLQPIPIPDTGELASVSNANKLDACGVRARVLTATRTPRCCRGPWRAYAKMTLSGFSPKRENRKRDTYHALLPQVHPHQLGAPHERTAEEEQRERSMHRVPQLANSRGACCVADSLRCTAAVPLFPSADSSCSHQQHKQRRLPPRRSRAGSPRARLACLDASSSSAGTGSATALSPR